ncbi:MAG: recombinase family protein [Paracoccaceae bacterium]
MSRSTLKMDKTPARIGYARTSTTDQNLDAQIAALEAAGCTMIRREQKSGTKLEGREELQTILDFIHQGETLVVTRIDRLARSLRDLQIIADKLKEKGAHLLATEQPVDTSTAAGKAFFDMLGVFAEFETNLRRERQAEGIACAKTRGVYKGRPAKIDSEAIKLKLEAGERPSDIARELGVSRTTVYKVRGCPDDFLVPRVRAAKPAKLINSG